MAQQRDFYEVLGIERTATSAQISESYRKLAIRFHPDKNPGNQEASDRFKEAARAFEVLSDDTLRARYDRFGHAGLQGGAGPQQFNDISDIFEAFGDIFGGGVFGGGQRRGGRPRPGLEPRAVRLLRRPRAGRAVGGRVSSADHLPGLPGARHADPRPVPRLRRRGAHGGAGRAPCPDPRGRRCRHPRAPDRRGRTEHPGGRSGRLLLRDRDRGCRGRSRSSVARNPAT